MHEYLSRTRLTDAYLSSDSGSSLRTSPAHHVSTALVPACSKTLTCAEPLKDRLRYRATPQLPIAARGVKIGTIVRRRKRWESYTLVRATALLLQPKERLPESYIIYAAKVCPPPGNEISCPGQSTIRFPSSPTISWPQQYHHYG